MEMNGQTQQQQPFAIPISAISGMPIRLSQSPAPSAPGGMRPMTTTYRLVSAGSPFTRLMTYPARPKNPVTVQRSPAPQMIAPQGQQPRFLVKRQGPVAAPMKIASNQLRMTMMNNNGTPVTQLQQNQFAQQQQLVFNQQGNQQVMPGPIARVMQHHQFREGQQQQQQQQFVQISQQQPDRIVKTIRKSLKSEKRPGVVVKKSPSVTPPQPSQNAKKSILMRLRCRTRPLPLHSTYYDNDTNEVHEKDADVVFMCGDGGRVRGHKVILASQSKFFTDAFQDQPIGEISMVSIPDISSDVMKLILLLAYKRSVVVNSDQIEKIKDIFEMFGVDFENLSAEPPAEEGGPLDVNPGVVMENIQAPHNPGGMSNNLQGSRRKMMPSFTTEQLENLQMNKRLPVDRSNQGVGNDFEGSDEETFKIQGYANNANLSHGERRKTKLTPRIETETLEDIEADLNNFPEPDENMIKAWMDKVGKNGPVPVTQIKGSPVKKRSPYASDFECKLCKATFFKESTWKWHEDRHFNHGIYKCTICDVLKTTSRAIWIHEEGVHQHVAIPVMEIMEIPEPPISVSPQKENKMVAELKRLKAAKLEQIQAAAEMKIKNLGTPPAPSDSYSPKSYRASPIKVRQPEEDEVEVRKIKQLQYMYVCARCDTLSDDSDKAQLHFEKCYPDGGVLFESTVAKYRQGFYGRSKCPLGKCVRRYVTNGGWTIHIGHQHEDWYRKLFSHTGSVEDKIKCVNCSRKFTFPEDFHSHLHKGAECLQSPHNEEVVTPSQSPAKNSSVLEPAAASAPAAGSSPSIVRKKEKIPTTPNKEVKKEDTKQPIAVKSKPVPVPPTPPVAQPPRSARLAKRASALLMEKLLHEQDEEGDDEEGYPKKASSARKRAKPAAKVAKRRTASIASTNSNSSAKAQQNKDYPAIECPVCGSEIVEISQHFSTEHKDMNVNVDRVSADLLKCRDCSMTFGVDDIFGHPGVCGKNKQLEEGGNDDDARSETSSITRGSSPTKRELRPEPYEIPEGVGCSPVAEMGYSIEELLDKEIILKTLTCPVCHKERNRMGQVTHCLKLHGISRCSICFNTYSKREDYDRHMKICHLTSMSRARCPFCPERTFINVGQCVGHMQITHWVEYFARPRGQKRQSSTASSKQTEQPEESENATNDSEKTSKETEEEGASQDKMEDDEPNKVSDDDKNINENDDSKMEVEDETDESKPEPADKPAKISDETAEEKNEVPDNS